MKKSVSVRARRKAGRASPGKFAWLTPFVLPACLALVLTLAGVTSRAAVESGKATLTPLKEGAGPASWAGDLNPITEKDWNYERAAHLLERAGFGGTPEEIQRLAGMAPEKAVDELVNYESKDNSYLPKFEESGILPPGVIPTIEENTVRAAINEVGKKGKALGVEPDRTSNMPLQPIIDEAYYHVYASRLESRRLANWWANRMLQTNRPLEEKIAVFWHDHFALSYERVEDYRKLHQYMDVLWKDSTGNFRTFVLDIARNPAMLIYLDNGLNVKGHPNENFAREVMELFTMGEGHGYTEHDIREVARSFTGWTQDDLKFVNKTELHDEGEKTVFGKKANYNGETIIDWIVDQKATSLYITGKLYKYFVAEEMSEDVNEKLAKQFKDSKYEIKPLLRTMFLSKDFYGPKAYATQIKTPIHLIVSTSKKLGLKELPTVPDFRATITALGQEILAPPNVAGWEGGRSWINPATLLLRGNYVRNIFEGKPEDITGIRRPAAGGELDRPRIAANALSRSTAAGGGGGMSGGMEAGGAMAGGARGGSAMAGSAMAGGTPGRIATAPRGQNPGGEMGSMTAMPASTSPNNRYANRAEYNLALGVNRGMAKASKVVKETPQKKAEVQLAAMAQSAGVNTTDEAVDYFIKRYLRMPLGTQARGSLVEHLNKGLNSKTLDYRAPATEENLRELTHLIMSMPEYQLS